MRHISEGIDDDDHPEEGGYHRHKDGEPVPQESKAETKRQGDTEKMRGIAHGCRQHRKQKRKRHGDK
ncbi:hypothetical protein SDC9_209335 [bioreactor metagenome]|uniref:Uncharacterized protein n=1 Tax=bioreactor metagenome TaxID=1076179 RepID=A0A645JE38_9ZZZZ